MIKFIYPKHASQSLTIVRAKFIQTLNKIVGMISLLGLTTITNLVPVKYHHLLITILMGVLLLSAFLGNNTASELIVNRLKRGDLYTDDSDKNAPNYDTAKTFIAVDGAIDAFKVAKAVTENE